MQDSVFSSSSERKASCGSLQLQDRPSILLAWWVQAVNCEHPPWPKDRKRAYSEATWLEGCERGFCTQRLGSSLVLSFTHYWP